MRGQELVATPEVPAEHGIHGGRGGAGPGATGGCFVHERHARAFSLPRLAGWWGNDPATRFQMHAERRFVPRAGADGWQDSNPPILALASLRASLDLFDAPGWMRCGRSPCA